MRINRIIIFVILILFSVSFIVNIGCIKTNETETDSKYNSSKSLLEMFEYCEEISDTEVMAHCAMTSYDNYLKDGTTWFVYYGNYINKKEYRENKDTSIYLIKYNLFTKEKIKIRVLSYNDINFDYLEAQTPYDPNLIVTSDSIMIYYTSFNGTDESIRYVRINKKSMSIVEADFIKINIDGTFYNATVRNLKRINFGYDVGEFGYLVFSSNFRYYGDKIYGCICSFVTQKYNGLIVSTKDGINWDIVWIPNLGINGCNEADFIITEYYIYYAVRTESNVILIIYNKEKLELTKKIISNHCAKPLLNHYRSGIYCTVNIEDYSSDDICESYRNQICVYKIDFGEVSAIEKLYYEYGISYFTTFMVYDSFYMLFTTDLDKSDTTQNKKDIVLFRIKNL